MLFRSALRASCLSSRSGVPALQRRCGFLPGSAYTRTQPVSPLLIGRGHARTYALAPARQRKHAQVHASCGIPQLKVWMPTQTFAFGRNVTPRYLPTSPPCIEAWSGLLVPNKGIYNRDRGSGLSRVLARDVRLATHGCGSLAQIGRAHV